MSDGRCAVAPTGGSRRVKALISTTPLRTPEAIAQGAGLDAPRLLLPDPSRLFGDRALRLRELAAGHAMRDYLMLMALVCEAQQARVQRGPVPRLPMPQELDAAAQAGEAPLDARSWQREALWHSELRALSQDLLGGLPADSPARPAVLKLAALPEAALEQQAGRLLAGITLGQDLAVAPFVAAGLQLYFTRLVAVCGAAQPAALAPRAPSTRCPCCGSLPVASVTRLGGQQEGQRYLHCMLCSTQWHLERIQCTHCLATDGIRYQSLQPVADAAAPTQRPAVEAETCSSCRHYLKILHLARELHLEPVADDLATLTLDLLVSEAGFERHGANLLLLFGDSEAQAGGG